MGIDNCILQEPCQRTLVQKCNPFLKKFHCRVELKIEADHGAKSTNFLDKGQGKFYQLL
jgi:hypothetical protein